MNACTLSRPWQHVPKSNTFTYACKASSSSVNSRRKEVNFYKVLSLDSSKDVGVDEIKSAYRSMVLRYHPDVCPPTKREESTTLFIELQRAYETLSDPITREKYDNRPDSNPIDEELGQGRRERFPKEVWMNQLGGLNARSNRRNNARN